MYIEKDFLLLTVGPGLLSFILLSHLFIHLFLNQEQLQIKRYKLKIITVGLITPAIIAIIISLSIAKLTLWITLTFRDWYVIMYTGNQTRRSYYWKNLELF